MTTVKRIEESASVRRIARILPAAVKQSFKARLRLHAIRRALRPLKIHGKMTESEVTAFHKAWGNEGFAADRTYLMQLLRLLKSGPVLECGTGGTTLLANEMGLRRGFTTHCLEQEHAWAEAVQWRPAAVQVLNAPLRNFGEYHWYEVRAHLPSHFALVVCDGPRIDQALGEPHYSAWRYGVLPWLKSTGRTYDALLLDDVDDSRAPAVLERWRQEFGVTIECIRSGDGKCAIVRPAG